MDDYYGDEDEEEEKENEEASNTIEGYFTRRAGCYKDMRAHGKKGDNGVTMKLQVPSSLFQEVAAKKKNCSHNDEEEYEHKVDVVAGWATNHEAVTLTYSIEFRPRVQGSCSSSEEL